MKKNRTKVFLCDCYDREHSLITAHFNGKDYEEVYFEFASTIGDWNSYQDYHNVFKRFYRRLKWRFRHAYNALVHGSIYYEGSWIPVRSYGDKYLGEQTLKELSDWLLETDKIIKENIEEKRISLDNIK
jgi:hypothetical protein